MSGASTHSEGGESDVGCRVVEVVLPRVGLCPWSLEDKFSRSNSCVDTMYVFRARDKRNGDGGRFSRNPK